MIYYVLPLEHKQATIEIVGGKGMSLSKLLTAGIPVPDGFHVTTASYQIFVETNHIQSRINKLLERKSPSPRSGRKQSCGSRSTR